MSSFAHTHTQAFGAQTFGSGMGSRWVRGIVKACRHGYFSGLTDIVSIPPTSTHTNEYNNFKMSQKRVKLKPQPLRRQV